VFGARIMVPALQRRAGLAALMQVNAPARRTR
jgi:hypothetical protein